MAVGGGQTKLMDYKSGDYFGEKALLTNDVRAANIIVTSDEAKTLSLDRETFKRLLGPLDDILKRNMGNYEKVWKSSQKNKNLYLK